ncbi:MAG: Exopolyphosphatase, partial [uncultured Ramlibacter sp.]
GQRNAPGRGGSRLQQFPPGDRPLRPRADPARRVPEGNGAPGRRPGRGAQPDGRGDAAWLGLPGALRRAALRFSQGPGARGRDTDPARGAKPRRVPGARPPGAGLPDRRHLRPRGSAPDLPGRGPPAAAVGRTPAGGGHRRPFHRADPGPPVRGQGDRELPCRQRGLVDALLPGRRVLDRQLRARQHRGEGGPRRGGRPLRRRKLGRGLRLLGNHRRRRRHPRRSRPWPQRVARGPAVAAGAAAGGATGRPRAAGRIERRPAPRDRRRPGGAAGPVRPARHPAPAARGRRLAAWGAVRPAGSRARHDRRALGHRATAGHQVRRRPGAGAARRQRGRPAAAATAGWPGRRRDTGPARAQAGVGRDGARDRQPHLAQRLPQARRLHPGQRRRARLRAAGAAPARPAGAGTPRQAAQAGGGPERRAVRAPAAVPAHRRHPVPCTTRPGPQGPAVAAGSPWLPPGAATGLGPRLPAVGPPAARGGRGLAEDTVDAHRGL